MRIWKLTSRAFPSKYTNTEFRYMSATFFKFNVSNLRGGTFSKPLLPWKESQPEWEFGSLRAKQFRPCSRKFVFRWTLLTLMKFNVSNLKGDTFSHRSRLEGIQTRMRVWKLTSRAIPSRNTNIKFRWTSPTFFKFNVSNLKHFFQTFLPWKRSQPEWKFGSWRARHFRRVTPILSFAERHQLSSNSTYRTCKVKLFPNRSCPGRNLNQNESLEADERSNSVNAHRNLQLLLLNVTNFNEIQCFETWKVTLFHTALAWKESQPEWEFGSWQAEQFRPGT